MKNIHIYFLIISCTLSGQDLKPYNNHFSPKFPEFGDGTLVCINTVDSLFIKNTESNELYYSNKSKGYKVYFSDRGNYFMATHYDNLKKFDHFEIFDKSGKKLIQFKQQYTSDKVIAISDFDGTFVLCNYYGATFTIYRPPDFRPYYVHLNRKYGKPFLGSSIANQWLNITQDGKTIFSTVSSDRENSVTHFGAAVFSYNLDGKKLWEFQLPIFELRSIGNSSAHLSIDGSYTFITATYNPRYNDKELNLISHLVNIDGKRIRSYEGLSFNEENSFTWNYEEDLVTIMRPGGNKYRMKGQLDIRLSDGEVLNMKKKYYK